MTETYVAYGATRDLIKECTRPGEYKIPQALVKRGEIPVDEDGVHLGEAEGWWYDSTLYWSKQQANSSLTFAQPLD
jgi:cytochrome b pre-mRNA-processing protein 3